MRILVTHPPDPRPSLVVETVEQVDEPTLAAIKQRMIQLRCPNGLLFDAHLCVILRDNYTALDPSSIVEESRLPTAGLLARVHTGGLLEHRVMEWLRAMAASWNDTLRPSDVAKSYLADIVLAVSGSSLRQVA